MSLLFQTILALFCVTHIRCLYQQCSVLGWFCFLKGSFKVGCFLSTESWRALASIQCHSNIQDIATPLASIFLHCETTMDQAFLGVRIWQRTKQAMISCSSEEVPTFLGPCEPQLFTGYVCICSTTSPSYLSGLLS